MLWVEAGGMCVVWEGVASLGLGRSCPSWPPGPKVWGGPALPGHLDPRSGEDLPFLATWTQGLGRSCGSG